MSNVLKQLDLLTRGAAVKRFHTLRTISADTVGEHSHSVATLVYIVLGQLASAKLLAAALLHDLAECEYGDVPAPTKKSLREAGRLDIGILEDTLLAEVGLGVSLTSDEAVILKCCDILSGLLFCAKEKMLGNNNLSHVVDNYSRYYEGLVIPVYAAGRAWEIYNYAREVFYERKR